MWESELILLITQVLGQDISTLPVWLKLPVDVVMQVVEMKSDPEKFKKMKEQSKDLDLWETMRGMSK